MRGFTKMAMVNRTTGADARYDDRDRYRYEDDRAYTGNSEPESRRRRDSRGRFLPKNEWADNAYDAYDNYEGRYNEDSRMRMRRDDGWVVKPIHEEMENRRYRMDDGGGRMIGFDSKMRMHQGEPHKQEHKQGDAHGENGLDRKSALQWVNKMENSDGSRGQRFTMEQTEEQRKEMGVEVSPVEFWVAMNAMYSDYCAVAKKHGITGEKFWAEMAKAFLEDEDAEDDKLALYYECIVKK